MVPQFLLLDLTEDGETLTSIVQTAAIEGVMPLDDENVVMVMRGAPKQVTARVRFIVLAAVLRALPVSP